MRSLAPFVLIAIIALPIAAASSTVVVRDATTGEPIPGARVAILSAEGVQQGSATTDGAGFATLTDIPELARLDVTAPYHETVRHYVKAEAVPGEFLLQPAPGGVWLNGSARYEGTELPVVNASLQLTGPLHLRYLLPGAVLTDSAGQFAVRLPPGEYFATLSAGSRYVPATWAGMLNANTEAASFRIASADADAVPWRVGITGAPASEHFAVAVRSAGDGWGGHLVYPSTASEVSGLAPPGRYVAIAIFDDISYEIGTFEVSTSSVDAGTLSVDRHSFARVHVADDGGKPIERALAESVDPDRHFRAYTSVSGEILVPPMMRKIQVSAGEHETAVIELGEQPETFVTIARVPRVAARFALTGGTPGIPDANLLLIDSANRSQSSRTNESGEAAASVAPGPCFVIALTSRTTLATARRLDCSEDAAQLHLPSPVEPRRVTLSIESPVKSSGTLLIWDAQGRTSFVNITIPSEVSTLLPPGSAKAMFIGPGVDPNSTDVWVPLTGAAIVQFGNTDDGWRPDENVLLRILEAEPMAASIQPVEARTPGALSLFMIAAACVAAVARGRGRRQA
ncbi:MAG TPA: hypothetical protein VM370_09700 [Candidatus Thermoplasmatota archaeon]|nr:hypothetical protein [Candidatus Thermoplasmatota archaeon]